LLQAFAARVRALVRASDTLARLGGDAFSLIAENLRSGDDARTLAAKIVESARAPFTLESHRLEVTTSIGVALSSGARTDAASLLRQADTALYDAKKAGRNGFRLVTAARSTV
jgi:diguanylate cyclase (GGDEF)-like protein